MESVATAKKTEEEESSTGDYPNSNIRIPSNSTAIIPIDCELSSIDFLTSLVQEEPQIKIEDIKFLLNGRITIHVSEYYQFKNSGNRVDLSPQLSEFEGDEDPAVEECDNLMNSHCPLLNRDTFLKYEQTEAEDTKATPVQATNSASKNEIKAMPEATPKIVEKIPEENIYLHVVDMEIVPVPSTNTSHSSSPSSVFISQINRDSTKSIPRTPSLLDDKPQLKTEEVETRNRNSENNSIHIHVDDKVSHTTKSFAKSQLINTSKYSQQPATINKNKIQSTPKQKNISGVHIQNKRINKRLMSRGLSKSENHSCSTDSGRGRSLQAGAGLPVEFTNTNHTKVLTANRKLRSTRTTIRATSVIKNKKILDKSSPRHPSAQSQASSRRSSSRSRIMKDDDSKISKNIPEEVNVTKDAEEEEIHSPKLDSPSENCSSYSVDLPIPVLENNNGIVQIRTDPLSSELPPPMVYCASDNLTVGMFYLASQEGNRLQVMRYNGFTFEPYDWSNACKEDVAVAEGGL